MQNVLWNDLDRSTIQCGVGIVEDAVSRDSEEGIRTRDTNFSPTSLLGNEKNLATLVKYTSVGKVVLRYVITGSPINGTYCTSAMLRQYVNLCLCTEEDKDKQEVNKDKNKESDKDKDQNKEADKDTE